MYKIIWRKYLTIADKILLLISILATLGSLAVFHYLQAPGQMVEVLVANKEVAVFPLAQDANYQINGVLGEVVLQIKDGAVHIESVSCPNKLCQHMGWIKNSGETVVCLPNQLVLRINGENKEGVDAVAR